VEGPNSNYIWFSQGEIPTEILSSDQTRQLSNSWQLSYKPYRIIYRVVANRVYIYLIADGRRDFQTLLAQRLLRA